MRRTVVVIGDSVKANALGRALSMTMTAGRDHAVELMAVDDGPVWVGHLQFPGGPKLQKFKVRHWRRVARSLATRSQSEEIIVWFSKGTYPLDSIASRLVRKSSATVIADFDDDDVAIMRSFISQSVRNRLKMPLVRRKSPARLKRSQSRILDLAHGRTFSSPTLRDHFLAVPHTRADAPRLDRGVTSTLRLGFFGTVRAHKGAQHLVELLRSSSQVEVYSFRQSWKPPVDVSSRWHEIEPTTPLDDAYSEVDFLVLPMDASDSASLHQLPAKLVDAARAGCPVVATRTPVLDDFVQNRYLAVGDWGRSDAIVDSMRTADRTLLGEGIRASFEAHFSVGVTSASLAALLDRTRSSKTSEKSLD
jgi:hypothetical protein